MLCEECGIEGIETVEDDFEMLVLVLELEEQVIKTGVLWCGAVVGASVCFACVWFAFFLAAAAADDGDGELPDDEDEDICEIGLN